LFFKNIRFGNDPNSTPQQATIYAYPQWTNSGEVPTHGLRFSIFCGDAYRSFDYVANGDNFRMLGPKQTDGGGRCQIILTSIPDHPGVIGMAHIGGKATYFNNARDKQIRITEFCQIAPIVRVNAPNGFEIRVGGTDGTMICPEHNCADTECPSEDRQEQKSNSP
jgi:hypothetical protein